MKQQVLLSALALSAGIGIPSSAIGIHHLTKEKIKDQTYIKENHLPINDNSLNKDWNNLRTHLLSIKEKITNKDLTDILSKSSSDNSELKNWCSKSYDSTYKSLLISENEVLLNDVKTACILKIEKSRRLDFSKDQEEEHKDHFIKKLKVLKKHSNNEKDISLNQELKKINTDDENSWKQLKDWCKETYNKGYQGKQQNIWKLARMYCIKPFHKK